MSNESQFPATEPERAETQMKARPLGFWNWFPMHGSPMFWLQIAAVILYLPAIVAVVAASSTSSALSTSSGSQQPWYGTAGTVTLIALVVLGLLTDTRFMSTMGGVIHWNRMAGWQKALVGFFYFLGLLPLGIGVFFAVSLLKQRYPEVLTRAIPSIELPTSNPSASAPVGGSPMALPGWAPQSPSSIPGAPAPARDSAAARTLEDERVLATTRERLGCAFWFGVVITLGIWLLSLPWWAKRSYTLTDRRVIVRRGIWWKSENSIPLRNIQDVNVTYGPLSGMVTVVSARGAIVFPPVPVAAAREFADAYYRVSGASKL